MTKNYEEPHTHCWHKVEMGYSYQLTPDWKEKCCWCGAQRTVHREAVTPEGHGPFAPKVYKDRYDD